MPPPLALSYTAELALRLAIDLGAIAVLAGVLFRRRHGRMDLAVVYALFNVGLFLALAVIARGEIGIGVGFGLFAVLSIVRLRSEPYPNRELAYFFLALVLALVCALDIGPLLLPIALAAVALAAAWAIDHPRLETPARHAEVVLEVAEADEGALRGQLEARLAADVTEIVVLEIDYVREMTRVSVRTVQPPPWPPPPARS